MLDSEICIERSNSHDEIRIDIHNLKDIEQSILNYMLLSNINFIEIKSELSENDFTFLIHKVIYKYLLILEDMFLADSFHGIYNLESLLKVFSEVINEKENVKITSILDILSQPPSMYIKRDLEIINANSMEKEIAISSNAIERKGTIETKDGLTWFHFINDRLISVGTTNVAQLPTELHDNFRDTFAELSKLDLQNGENEASMTFYGDANNPDGIESFYLKKDVPALKWFDDICLWADKYDLDEDVFPRDRNLLQDLCELDISKKGISELPQEIGKLTNLRILIMDDNNIKVFPDELYQLKRLWMLSFLDNEISYISEEIINLEDLLVFAACHNQIAVLPKNFYMLKNLTIFCLHGNKLTSLSNDIGNLVNLTSIAISNNDIKTLPPSIAKLKSLVSLDIENTKILSVPIDLLNLPNLEKLSINDDLFPLIAKNIKYLNMDTINLTFSHYQEYSKIVQELNFNIDTEMWMEEKDKRDNGCVQLSKYSVKEEEEEEEDKENKL